MRTNTSDINAAAVAIAMPTTTAAVGNDIGELLTDTMKTNNMPTTTVAAVGIDIGIVRTSCTIDNSSGSTKSTPKRYD